jgi:hypothetical protein
MEAGTRPAVNALDGKLGRREEDASTSLHELLLLKVVRYDWAIAAAHPGIEQRS